MQLELALLRERGVLGDNKHLGTAKSNWGKLGKTRGNWGKLGTRDSVTFAESLDPSMARKLILAYKLHRASEPQRAYSKGLVHKPTSLLHVANNCCFEICLLSENRQQENSPARQKSAPAFFSERRRQPRTRRLCALALRRDSDDCEL